MFYPVGPSWEQWVEEVRQHWFCLAQEEVVPEKISDISQVTELVSDRSGIRWSPVCLISHFVLFLPSMRGVPEQAARGEGPGTMFCMDKASNH